MPRFAHSRRLASLARFSATLSLCLALPAAVHAADRVDEALPRATQYLLQQQDKKDGAISNKMRNETAMTSLSILALAAHGASAGRSDAGRPGGARRRSATCCGPRGRSRTATLA